MEKLDHYEGQVLNGKFHGRGKLTNAAGVIADGTFENGYLEGEAKVSFPDGRIYLVQIKDRVAIEHKLVEEKTVKNKQTKAASPYQPSPGLKSKPKGSIFPFLGMDFSAE